MYEIWAPFSVSYLKEFDNVIFNTNYVYTANFIELLKTQIIQASIFRPPAMATVYFSEVFFVNKATPSRFFHWTPALMWDKLLFTTWIYMNPITSYKIKHAMKTH